MAKTQRNKATAQHLGLLKARLAKLRRELLTPKSGGGGPGEGFDVAKTGDARIGFVGKLLLSNNVNSFTYTFLFVIRISFCGKVYSFDNISGSIFGSSSL